MVNLHNGVLHKKKKDILKFAGKWMDLGNIIFNDVTQIQKENKICTHS